MWTVREEGPEREGIWGKARTRGMLKRNINGEYEVNLHLSYQIFSESHTDDLCAVGFI